MPADTNHCGDIFGGWLLGQMDIAGGIFAACIAKGRTATVAVDAMTFRNPVSVGDVMCIYTDLIRIGNTSVTVHVEAWVIRRTQTDRLLVTDGNFTYVALDSERRPRAIDVNGYQRQGNMLGRLAVVVASGGAQAKGDGCKVRGVNDRFRD